MVGWYGIQFSVGVGEVLAHGMVWFPVFGWGSSEFGNLFANGMVSSFRLGKSKTPFHYILSTLIISTAHSENSPSFPWNSVILTPPFFDELPHGISDRQSVHCQLLFHHPD